MRIFSRLILNTGAVPFGAVNAAVTQTVQLPDVEGHLVALGFRLSSTITDTAAGANYTRRDMLRAVNLSLQDDSGEFVIDNLNLEDLEIIQNMNELGASGVGVYAATAVAGLASVTNTFNILLPYMDKRKGTRGEFDFAVEAKQALNSLRYTMTALPGSAATLFISSMTLQVYAFYTPDLTGHVGIRRKWVGVDYASAGYDVDGGDERYAVSDIAICAPYASGVAGTLGAYGAVTLYEGSQTRMTGVNPVTANQLSSRIKALGRIYEANSPLNDANGVACELYCAPIGYSSRDLLRGRIRADFAAIPATVHAIVGRVYALDSTEISRRHPAINAVPVEVVAETIKPTAEPQSERTKLFTPKRFSAPQEGMTVDSTLAHLAKVGNSGTRYMRSKVK